MGFDSHVSTVKHGVPQGSVLGPLLFLIYINDLHNAITYSDTYHFADDTNLLNIDSSYKKMQTKMNYDLKSLYKWLLSNKISLNTAKTELIFFRKPHNLIPNDIKIKLHGTRLFPVNKIKYLGFYLDEHLDGSAHIMDLKSKLRCSIGMLAKTKPYLPKNDLIQMYLQRFLHICFMDAKFGAFKTKIYVKLKHFKTVLSAYCQMHLIVALTT